MDLKLFAKAYQSVQEKKLDPVGKEDGDVDNDGDKDSSDSYLMKRRKAIAKAMKKEEVEVAEHHQKDADGKVIEHEEEAPGTPSSVEEESQETVLAQLSENGRGIDEFEAVVSYLIDEGFAKTWEEAQNIMGTLKPELVQEVYQNQLWTLFDENYHAMRNPEKYEEKPYKEKSKKERMADPDRGINSPAFKKFMASQGM